MGVKRYLGILNDRVDDIIRVLLVISGFFVMSGSVFAINIGERNIAIVNICYILLIACFLIKSKMKIYINRCKKVLITFCILLTCQSLVSYITNANHLTMEALILTVKMVIIALGVSLFVNDKQMRCNSQIFLKALYMNTIVQMVWSWLEKILYEVLEFKLNEFIFGDIFGIESSHPLTFIQHGQIRPSGFSWEPANLSMVLVFGYILSRNVILKILFAVTMLISSSATGMILIGAVIVLDIIYNIIITKKIKLEKKYLSRYIAIAMVAVVSFMVLALTTDVMSNTIMRFVNIFTGNADSSSNRHMAYYFESIDIIKNGNIFESLFGHGTYMAGHIFTTQLGIYKWLIDTLWNPETDFVTLLIGNGIVGCVCYYYFVITILKNKIKNNYNEFFVVMMVLVGGITYIFFRNAWILMMFAMFCYDEQRGHASQEGEIKEDKATELEGERMCDKGNRIKIVLLGLDFNSDNFGCSALGFSFLSILEKIAKKDNLFLDISSVNYNEFNACSEYYRVDSLRVRYKTPSFYVKYLKVIRNADLVFDFTGGDSFTDIYGKSRFDKETLLKQLAIWNKKRLVLGPQTIGPFNDEKIAKKATKVMRACEKVYVRDKMSQDYATKLGVSTSLTTDVAFVLSIDEQYEVLFADDKTKLGLNISGLMWNGGYTGNNDFGLKLDYKEYCKCLIDYANSKQYQVHLISHVISDDPRENDYDVALKIKKMYPEVVVAPRFSNPLQAKAYLSKMDMFVGSRMHATVGAFSRGVPTLSVAYSRKFQGLYSGIGYSHVIDAKAYETDEAIERTIKWIENTSNVQLDVDNSLKIVSEKAKSFETDIEKLLLSVITT